MGTLFSLGMTSILFAQSIGISQRTCMSYSPAETREMLDDLRKRHEALGLPLPLSVTVDNCCQVRRFIREALGQDVAVCLDVYHFIMRYDYVSKSRAVANQLLDTEQLLLEELEILAAKK